MPFLPPNQQRQSTEGTSGTADLRKSANINTIISGNADITNLCLPLFCDEQRFSRQILITNGDFFLMAAPSNNVGQCMHRPLSEHGSSIIMRTTLIFIWRSCQTTLTLWAFLVYFDSYTTTSRRHVDSFLAGNVLAVLSPIVISPCRLCTCHLFLHVFCLCALFFCQCICIVFFVVGGQLRWANAFTGSLPL